MMENPGNRDVEYELPPSMSEGYALTGKIMMTAILILFAVVVFMVGLHIYARCYLLRSRRRQFRRRTHLIFSVESNNPNAVTVTAASHGLDAHVLSSLPVFVYSSETHPEALECAVCLSEFEENEKGRFLPKCNHSFHIDCIDMWFHSHSTCPLCRSPAEPVPENKPDVVVSVGESAEIEPGSSTGLCPMCHHEEGVSMASSSSSSLGDRRKAVGMASVTIEVPGRTESEDELGTSSPASQGWKSPATRFLSRILSMNKKGSAVSPSSGMIGTSGGYGTDIECGRDELTQQRTRVQTPR